MISKEKQETGLAHLQSDLSPTRLMAHIAEFDKWTKHAGTPEEMESLSYVEGMMRAYGYHTELILHDAYISLPGLAHIRGLDRDIPGITHSFSRASGSDGVAGRVIYVGSGTAQDYVGEDVRGRIVLVEGIASPAATVEANRQGAIGQIHISPHQYVHEMCISPVWGSPGDDQVERLPRTVVITVPLDEGEALKKAATSREGLEATLFAEVDTEWRQTPILVAEMSSRAGDPDEPLVLFTGHHDTWYRGVMDNGGANATMLEVSRLCALDRDEWKRGLRVIYWSGHSQGRYSSSAWYADHHWEELERRAVAHVNVDSTGGKGNTVVADTTAAAELRDVAREAISSQSGQAFSGRRMQRAGDQSFWGIGVPSIFGNMSEQPATTSESNASASVFGGGKRLGHGTGWWWHTPYDTGDKIDEEILVRDTRIYLQAVWRLLIAAILPLNYAEYTDVMLQRLKELQTTVGDRFDLSLLLNRAAELREKACALNVRATPADADRVNKILLSLSRKLVPIEYTKGDRFVHDPALAQPSLPALASLLRLATVDQDTAEYKFLESRLIRERNRVAAALRDAIGILDTYLA